MKCIRVFAFALNGLFPVFMLLFPLYNFFLGCKLPLLAGFNKACFCCLPHISPLMLWSINNWKPDHQTCMNCQSKSKQVLREGSIGYFMCIFSAWVCLFWLSRGLLNLIPGSPLSSGKAARELNSRVVNYCYTLLCFWISTNCLQNAYIVSDAKSEAPKT